MSSLRALALLGSLALLVPARAGADRQQELDALRAAIEASRERVADYEQRQRGLLEALEALDHAALLLGRDVARARGAARAARAELAGIREQAADAEARLAVTRRAMASRAAALYRAGELGSVRLLFAADGLPEFLSRISALRRLLGLDAELLARHRRESLAFAEAQAAVEASSARLDARERELEARSAELAGERARKRGLAHALAADRTRERAALVELEKAARALEETLAGLGAERDAGPPLPGPSFQSLRQRLAPPVDGEVVRGFGRVVDAELLTETFHSGLLFDAPLGTPVEAVAAGRVRFAGWFRGYGQLVILDHGDGYFSVSGHLDSLDVAVGDAVQARHAIGRVGETGTLAGPRLYFEIRRGGEPLDPTDWLRMPGAR